MLPTLPGVRRNQCQNEEESRWDGTHTVHPRSSYPPRSLHSALPSQSLMRDQNPAFQYCVDLNDG
eukprot:1790780-Rhodomonas_salina.2